MCLLLQLMTKTLGKFKKKNFFKGLGNGSQTPQIQSWLFPHPVCSRYLVLLTLPPNSAYVDCVLVSPAAAFLRWTEDQSSCSSAVLWLPSCCLHSQSEHLKCGSNHIISLLLTLQSQSYCFWHRETELRNTIYNVAIAQLLPPSPSFTIFYLFWPHCLLIFSVQPSAKEHDFTILFSSHLVIIVRCHFLGKAFTGHPNQASFTHLNISKPLVFILFCTFILFHIYSYDYWINIRVCHWILFSQWGGNVFCSIFSIQCLYHNAW